MRGVVILVGLALASPTITSAHAQEFDLQKSTWTEFGGSLDFIMSLMGANGVKTQRVMVSGPLGTVRTDDVEDGRATNSNITEYTSGTVNVIDHDDQSYFTFNMTDMMAGGPFQFGGQPQPAAYQEPEPNEDRAEYDVSIEVDSPGGDKTLLGYLAERLWVTITATPTKAPEGMSLDSMPTFIMLTELWVSEDFPGNTAMQEISEEAAAQLSKSMGLDGDAMAQAFSQNPQFADAFEQNQEEMEKLRRMPLETLSVFASITPGTEFNPDSALYGSMGEMKIDVAGAVASGVRNAVTGGIGRRLGIGRRQEEPPPPPPAVQTLMFRVREVVERFGAGPLQSNWNIVPSTYEQKENPFAPRQPN